MTGARSSMGLAVLATVFGITPLAAETLVFTGATIHPVSGPAIEDAVMVVEGETISEIGRLVDIPVGAVTVDLAGKHVYPSFIHPYSALGLVEIRSVRGTVDLTEIGDINSHNRAEVAFHADSQILPVTMSGGVLLANVAPRGGLFEGTSALMRLEGWNWEDMTYKAPVGMHLQFPRTRPPMPASRQLSEEEAEEERERLLKLLNETLDDAQAYDKARKAATADSAPEVDFNPRLEALLPVLDGRVPLFIHADEKGQIEEALDWAKDREIERVILVTGADAQHVIERLVEQQIPVVLNGVLTLPTRAWEPYDAGYTAAARLHEAGVQFCIGDGGSEFGAANSRNLPFHAAMAAAFGLPKDEALRSITLSVAEILGVTDWLGSLGPGKDATFLVTNGDPLEIRTRIERAWLAGREVDLEADRQKYLFQKYSNRPQPVSGH